MSDNDERELDGDDDDESNPESSLVPRRGRVMSKVNMHAKTKNDLESKKPPFVLAFDSATCNCTNARAMRGCS